MFYILLNFISTKMCYADYFEQSHTSSTVKVKCMEIQILLIIGSVGTLDL